MCYTTKSIDDITGIRHVDGKITAQIRVPAGAVWFDGHFPGIAVLPGVAQLAIIAEVLGKILEKPIRVTNVSRVRFKQAIMPDELIDVQITPRENDLLTCGFRLLKGNELACSGFLKAVADI